MISPNAQTYRSLGLLSSGIEAFGYFKEGREKQEAYELNAGVALANASAIRERSRLSEFQKRKNLEALIGHQQAQYASSGIRVDTGSPIEVMTDTLAKGYLDIEIDKYNDEIAARYNENQAQMQSYYGKQEKKRSLLNAGLALVKGAANFG